MITLIINFDETNGQINVTGPLQNKILAYGMITLARDIIKEYQVGQPNIVAAGESDANNMAQFINRIKSIDDKNAQK